MFNAGLAIGTESLHGISEMDKSLNTGALSRIRVLELGSTISGPFCGRLLADFGAEVIKVEDPGGDTLRSIGRSFKGKSVYAASIFRNKRNIAIDLREPEGRDIVRRLAEKSDVLIENFRPGTLEKWGLGHEQLAKINPGLVTVRISGFGQSGPYSQRPGYGVIGEAVSGLRYINGDPDRPPTRMATALTDYITGLYAAFGAVIALFSRGMTGKGQVVDAALSECAFSFMEPYIPAYEKFGEIVKRAGGRLPGATPNNIYETQDNDFVLIAAFADGIFRRLCNAMGQADLAADPRYATAEARNERIEEVDGIVNAWTTKLPLSRIEEILLKHDVPATRIFSIADIFSDPQFQARGMLAVAPDEEVGDFTVAAPVPRLDKTPGVVTHAGREMGHDTAAILCEICGFDEAYIKKLIKNKIAFAR